MANCQLMVRRELALEDDVVGNTGPCLEYVLENHVLKQLCEAGLSNVSSFSAPTIPLLMPFFAFCPAASTWNDDAGTADAKVSHDTH